MKKFLVIAGIIVGVVLLSIIVSITAQQAPAPQETSQQPTDNAQVTQSTPTIQQQIGGMLNGDNIIMTYAGEVDVTYLDSNQIVDVQMSMIHTGSEDIKWTAYYAMKDIWTSGIKPIKGVSITMKSDQTNQVVAQVFQSHALDFDNLNQDSAWNAYDTATMSGP